MNKATFCIMHIHNLLIIALLGFISILSSQAVADNHLPKAPDQLKFGARVDAAPLSYKDGEDWKGYSIDLCRFIFTKYQEEYANLPADQRLDSNQSAGTQLTFIPVLAPERMDYLKEGNIDILCGATTVTVNRMRHVDFTLLTFVSGTSIMKKKGTDSSSLVSSVKNGGGGAKITYVGCTEEMEFFDCTTTGNWVTNQFGSAIKPIPKRSHTEAFNALDKGEAQFYVGDRVILENKLRTVSNSSDFVLAPTFLTFEPYAIAIAKGNDLLLHSANSTLARLFRNAGAANGIDTIYFNHFNNDQSEMLKKLYQLQSIPE